MAAKVTVLIVEDEGVVALDLRRRLRELNYDVVGVCATGEDAIKQAEALHPLLVLMDINLAGRMKGTEAAQTIHSMLGTPIVFLTAYSDPETLGAAKASLPYGYLVKPFDTRVLHATLQVALARYDADKVIAANEARLQLAVKAADLDVWELDLDRQRLRPGGRMERLFGAEPKAVGENCHAFLSQVHPDDRLSVEAALEESLAGGGLFHAVFRGAGNKGNEVKWYEAHGKLSDPQGLRGVGSARMVGIMRDITERRVTELRMREAAAVLEAAAEAILVFDAAGKILVVNPAFTTITGYTAEETIGQRWTQFVARRKNDTPNDDIQTALASRANWRGEVELQRKNGERFPAWLSVSTFATPDSGRHEVWLVADISALRQAEDRMRFMAYHDPLTGLPNRILFRERLTQAIAHSERRHSRCAVLLLDLDDFKMVNDTYGHTAGDELLQETARRITSCLRREDTVARLGGDEFAIVLGDLSSGNNAAWIAKKLIAELSAPLEIAGRTMSVAASIGISHYADDGKTHEELLKAADLALYAAKGAGRGTYRLFNQEFSKRLSERVLIEGDLKEALGGEGLVLHYQPQIAVADRRIIGLEALVRWNHPRFGLLSPMRFIPIAESAGLMAPLGRWVLKAACQYARGLVGSGLRVAINCSGSELANDNLSSSVREILAETGLPAYMLEVEITEGTLHDFAESAKCLRDLRDLGVSITVDDFGIGYSSLSALKHLPINRIKIDQSFIRDVPGDENDESIVTAIIGLAHSLGHTVIGEGVETQDQLDFLRQRGCDEVQGYLFAKPMPPDDLAGFMRSYSNRT